MMVDYFIFFPILLSFFVSLFFMPYWIKKAKSIGLIWKDMNKFSEVKVAGSGGIIAVLAFVVGVLLFVAYRTFIIQNQLFLIEIFATLSSIFFLASIGFIDDLFGWQSGGLRRRHRIILVALAAIPLIVINAGKSAVALPLFGHVDFGIIYPIIFIPIGIVGAATTFNFLAGFNGLEAGEGIIMLSALSIVAFLTGNAWLSIIGLCMVASLLGFLIFNFYPAKVFPGDSLTYSVGGLIAIISILGNFEKVAVFFFIPVILEVMLKIRGKLTKYSFGKPKKDGAIDLMYNKVYSLNHLAIFIMDKFGIKPTERKIVFAIWLFQIIIILAGFIIFRRGLFL